MQGTAASYRSDALKMRGIPELAKFASGYERIADALEHGVTCECGRKMSARSNAAVYVCEFGCWNRVDLMDDIDAADNLNTILARP